MRAFPALLLLALSSCGMLRDLWSPDVVSSRVRPLAARVADRAEAADSMLADEGEAVLALLEAETVPEWRLRGPVKALADGHDPAWVAFWVTDPEREWKMFPLDPFRVHQHLSESNSLRFALGIAEVPLLSPEALGELLTP